jgi:hypothetical protein
MLNTKCQITVLKIKESLITEVEAKILSFMFVKNKQITTIDFTGCIDESMQNFGTILSKLTEKCAIKYITLDNIEPGLTFAVEPLAKALRKNHNLEVLNMKKSRIKKENFCSFWTVL